MGDSDSSKLGVVYSRFLAFFKKKKEEESGVEVVSCSGLWYFQKTEIKETILLLRTGRVTLNKCRWLFFLYFSFFIWKSNNKGNKSWTNKSWREETGDGSLLASKLPFVVHRDVDSLVVLFHLLKEKRTLLANNYPMLQSLCIVSFR